MFVGLDLRVRVFALADQPTSQCERVSECTLPVIERTGIGACLSCGYSAVLFEVMLCDAERIERSVTLRPNSVLDVPSAREEHVCTCH